MRIILSLLLCLLSLSYSYSQMDELTSEERAYLFHIVKKSPILDHNIGRYFVYHGPEIYYTKDKLNYDSIETYIINQPDLLTIYTSEIRKSPVGIVAEAANKVAIWELNKTLLAKRSNNDKEISIYLSRYLNFEDSLIRFLPLKSLKTDKDGKWEVHPKVESLLNPSLSLNDKIKIIETFHFLNQDEQIKTLEAINRAINSYVKHRSEQIFFELGGKAFQYQNVLVAAGDGSTTSGLLEEREKDERGRWNKGLPKAVGLFPYQLYKIQKTKKEQLGIRSRGVTINDFFTAGDNLETNIHLDVWGYNSKKQTTVVIERNGKSYHLFGAKDTRFLSPDSSFSGGSTYQTTVIDDLKSKISVLDEKIYGKKGFDYWIKFYEKKAESLKLEIVNLEQDISYISSFNIHTKGRSKSARAGELNNTQSNKQSRKEAQNSYIQKNEEWEECKRKIVELKKEKEEAIEIKEKYQVKLTQSIEAYGRNWVAYTMKDGIYTYEDSTIFNILTQDFTFQAKAKAEPFEIRLLSIPNTGKSDLSDEVMLHINVTSSKPNYDARVQLNFRDVFKSNDWHLNDSLLTQSDSISIHVFLEELLNHKKDFQLILRGNGIGEWNGFITVYNPDQIEMTNYPSGTAKEDSTFKRLRASYVNIFTKNNSTILEINSFTDPVRSTFNLTNANITKFKEKNRLTYNQILSGYRTASILFKLQEELNLFAAKNFTREEAKIIMDRINSGIGKSKILIGQNSLKSNIFK